MPAATDPLPAPVATERPKDAFGAILLRAALWLALLAPLFYSCLLYTSDAADE